MMQAIELYLWQWLTSIQFKATNVLDTDTHLLNIKLFINVDVMLAIFIILLEFST